MALSLASGGARGSECKLCAIELKVGMSRSEVEKRVAAALGTESGYSAYGSNLRGGLVAYRDGMWTLNVIYKPGTPAPWVVNQDGVAEHLPPIDESVLSIDVKREQQ